MTFYFFIIVACVASVSLSLLRVSKSNTSQVCSIDFLRCIASALRKQMCSHVVAACASVILAFFGGNIYHRFLYQYIVYVHVLDELRGAADYGSLRSDFYSNVSTIITET